MRDTLAQYFIALVSFLVIDVVWLSLAGPRLYVPEIGPLLRYKPDLVVAFLFYCLYVAGLMFFVLQPALVTGTLSQAVWKAAFFGLVAYATYDLTNLATVNGFTAKIAVIDMIWGATLSAGVAWTTFTLVKYFKLG